MSRKDSKSSGASSQILDARQLVLANFRLEDIRHLRGDDLAAAQQLAGHGSTLGRWETPSVHGSDQSIDLAKRIRHYLNTLDPEKNRNEHAVDEQIVEAALILTRAAVLMRTAPVGGRRMKTRNKPLKAETVSQVIYQRWPKIMAKALLSKDRANSRDRGFFCHLTADDVKTLSEEKKVGLEIIRLFNLADLGLWSDIPTRQVLQKVTSPSSTPAKAKPEHKSAPHKPLPMEWLSEIGPRVLWVVNELAPNLLRLLEQLREPLKTVMASSISEQSKRNRAQEAIGEIMARDPWFDSAGQLLVPPFRLRTARNPLVDNFEWPIRTWDSVGSLSTLVQAAHGFIVLLATAGRISPAPRFLWTRN